MMETLVKQKCRCSCFTGIFRGESRGFTQVAFNWKGKPKITREFESLLSSSSIGFLFPIYSEHIRLGTFGWTKRVNNFVQTLFWW